MFVTGSPNFDYSEEALKKAVANLKAAKTRKDKEMVSGRGKES